MPREAAAWCGAHRKLTARVVVFTVWSGVRSGRASQKRGPLKKVCSTDVSGAALEGQGTAEVAQSGCRGWKQPGCLEKQMPRVKAGARKGWWGSGADV